MTATSSAGVVQLRFQSIRNLTSPDEKKNGTRTYFANLPAIEILNLIPSRTFDTTFRNCVPGNVTRFMKLLAIQFATIQTNSLS